MGSNDTVNDLKSATFSHSSNFYAVNFFSRNSCLIGISMHETLVLEPENTKSGVFMSLVGFCLKTLLSDFLDLFT